MILSAGLKSQALKRKLSLLLIKPMKLLAVSALLLFQFSVTAFAFVPAVNKTQRSVAMSADGNKYEAPCVGEHPFNKLPGDPSLILTTNADLGDKKMDIMKGRVGSGFECLMVTTR